MSNIFETLGKIIDAGVELADALDEPKRTYEETHRMVRREAEEMHRRLDRIERPRPIYITVGEHPSVRTVAVYRGISTLGRPKEVLEVAGTVTWKKFRLTATDDGVRVQWFGTFGPERQDIDCGDDYAPFATGYCFAVL